ncbi:MAG: type II secretion system protein GspK [bacterium]|nr:type II secretion system protein GspK [bacterium]
MNKVENFKNQLPKNELGVALIIVLLVIALGSILVINLTQSTYRDALLNNASVKRLQAEYLLKSTINFARILIAQDASPDLDSPKDSWAQFSKGQAIPVPELLGINEPGLNIEIEIQAEDNKLPIRALISGDGPSGIVGENEKKWRDATVRLFEKLGFDDDEKEIDHTKTFPNKHFDSKELVALLIDFMDHDSDSYEDPEFSRGFEGDLAPDFFPNVRLKRIGELVTVPGFTPARLRKLTPLITVFENSRININLSPPIILESLNEEIDSTASKAIMEKRASEDPFSTQNLNSDLIDIIGSDAKNYVATMIKVNSGWFQILAKVDYGTTTYFMRTFVSRNLSREPGALPQIKSVELF